MQCVCVCMYVLFTQSCPTLCDPMDCSLPGSSVHGILQMYNMYMQKHSYTYAHLGNVGKSQTPTSLSVTDRTRKQK